MKHLTIRLPNALYRELLAAAALTAEDDADLPPAPEQFASECVESILASRRLERMMSV